MTRRMPDESPFFLNGKEVLCLRCKHRGEYYVAYDCLHHTDIYCGACYARNAFVGLPLNVCEYFEEVQE